jgi:hypothetical protein
MLWAAGASNYNELRLHLQGLQTVFYCSQKCSRAILLVPGRNLNCFTCGRVCKTLRTLLKGLSRAQDTAGLYGSWLAGIFLLPVSLVHTWYPAELQLAAQCLRGVSVVMSALEIFKWTQKVLCEDARLRGIDLAVI